MVSSISALLLLYQTQQLVPVGEAGHHVQRRVSVPLQQLNGLGYGIASDNLLPGDLRAVKAHSQIVDVLPAENDLFHMRTFQLIEIDVPQPAGLAGEIFPAPIKPIRNLSILFTPCAF